MKSEYIVEVVVKDGCGKSYTPKIDKFVGTPEQVVKSLTKKYCGRQSRFNILEWLYKPLEVSNEELRRRLR